MARSGRPKLLWLGVYGVLLIAALATHVFLWTLLATHMIWTFANAADRRAMPDILRMQLLALVAGSPLVAFAAYQSGTTVAVLSDSVSQYVWDYLPFSFWLPTEISGFFEGGFPFRGTAWTWARIAVFLPAAALAVTGIRRMWRKAGEQALVPAKTSVPALYWNLAWAAAGLVGRGGDPVLRADERVDSAGIRSRRDHGDHQTAGGDAAAPSRGGDCVERAVAAGAGVPVCETPAPWGACLPGVAGGATVSAGGDGFARAAAAQSARTDVCRALPDAAAGGGASARWAGGGRGARRRWRPGWR